MLNVADIMTRDPRTLGPDNTLDEARKLMADYHIRHVPIVDAKGELIGLVSHRDILAASVSSVAPAASPSTVANTSLAAIMTSPVKTVEKTAGLRGTALQMQQDKVGCLPVVDDHDLSGIIGIITDSDFVAVAIHLMEQIESAESDEQEYESEDIETLIEVSTSDYAPS